jgi:hypothetical protein
LKYHNTVITMYFFILEENVHMDGAHLRSECDYAAWESAKGVWLNSEGENNIVKGSVGGNLVK